MGGNEKITTNNRMELMAPIMALKKIKSKSEIIIFTDSTYVKQGITIWINNWEKNDWKTADKKNVKNIDLWKKLRALTKLDQIEWCWIKGHSNDPMNDLADKLARKAAQI